jgi:hypothetical protein
MSYLDVKKSHPDKTVRQRTAAKQRIKNLNIVFFIAFHLSKSLLYILYYTKEILSIDMCIMYKIKF